MRAARRVALVGAALVAIALLRPIQHHLQAAGLLARFADPATRAAWLPNPWEVEESSSAMRGPGGESIETRLYRPVGLARPPGMVLLHGIHRLGVHDPRLAVFARALASAGIAVMTPQIPSLTQYRVDREGVDFIGEAAVALAHRDDIAPGGVGIVGMSFAGGLALLAAADPRFASSVKEVLAVGAYDDLERVARFFATDEAQPVDGPPVPLAAHEYGVLVLAHSHPEDFFTSQDASLAEDVLLRWLQEDKEGALAEALHLSPEGRVVFDRLRTDRAALRPQLLASIAKHTAEMASASPRGQLASLRAPVFLLHGSGDTVIPATELGWLARDLPPGRLQGELLTPLLEHVSLNGNPSLGAYLRAIHFLAGVLADD